MMDRFGRIDFLVEGLSVERLLNRCAQEGVRLRRVRRLSPRSVRASAAPEDYRALCAFAGERGWRVTMERTAGLPRLRGITRARALLPAGVVLFAMLCWYVSSCLWFVEITGAGPYEAEVRRILAVHGVRPGRFLSQVDTQQVRNTMERELTGLSFASVHAEGVRLRVRCVEAEMLPALPDGPRSLIAASDGVIHSVVCAAGTPRVSPGDTVRAGDVLIEGVERGADGQSLQVAAQGSVRARVWHVGEAYVAGRAERNEPTGRERVRRVFCTPWGRVTFETPPDYAQYELETAALPVGGALPVWLCREIYRETRTVRETRPQREVQQEAGEAAMRLARESAGTNGEILDKWIEYSMINMEGYRATAVVETLREIAVPDNGT